MWTRARQRGWNWLDVFEPGKTQGEGCSDSSAGSTENSSSRNSKTTNNPNRRCVMGMKPIHGDGSEPIAGPVCPNLVNAANSHPSGKFGAVAHNTVTQPKYEGNQAKVVSPT